MSLLDIIESRQSSVRTPVIVTAKVTDNQDPEHLGRVKVKYPWRADDEESDWIRVMTPMSGNEMGIYFIPEVNDELVVAFQNGDINSPIILGSLWSSVIKPPDTNQDGKNNIRMIKSRSGHKIILDDKDGEEKVTIIDKAENSIIIDSKEKLITITSKKDMKLLAEDGKISISAKEIEVKSSSGTTMESGADFTVTASSGKFGVDVNELSLKAASQGTLEASASLTVKASGNTTIKGAMVMIN
jgi:uncharacterized protein involved in type VI secretion and phage assembly